MLKYLLIVLAEDATSFCHYRAAARRKGGPGLIARERLEAAVTFALKHDLKANVLYPARSVPKAYEAVIDGIDHVKIVPFAARLRHPGAILVIEGQAFPAAAELRPVRGANVILRLGRAELPRLAAFVGRLLPRAKRINLVLADLESYGPAEIEAYGRELAKVRALYRTMAPGKDRPELNALTDRLVLSRMNNCDAGLTHLTVGPDGRLHLCPGFYYDRPSESLGEIRNEIAVPNRRLLELKYAPICRSCDAFQCRRCIHLNRGLTLEVNTPSFQQCRTAHAEREAARLYADELRAGPAAAAVTVEIPELPYDDPFDAVRTSKTTIAEFKKMGGCP